mmetsp:Transcript_34868/g.74342  ORF Transcript_34868/g.74342 Transcript_34868/m.74342 type:complete len:146 (-) Transcript_34868:73-510(-)
MVWIISRATAVGMAMSCVPPTISHAARQSTGRMRFPPAMREYPIASHILSVWGIRDFTDAARASSIGPFFDRRYSSRLKAVDVDEVVADSLSAAAEEWCDGDGFLAGTKAEAYRMETARSAALRQDNFILSLNGDGDGDGDGRCR